MVSRRGRRGSRDRGEGGKGAITRRGHAIACPRFSNEKGSPTWDEPLIIRWGVRHCRSSAADLIPNLSSLDIAALTCIFKGKSGWGIQMEIEDFISAERLKTYQNLTDKHKKAIALHNHTLQLGTSLMAMIALLELSLRNITNQILIEDFGDKEWLLPGHTTLPLKPFERSAIGKAYGHAQKAAYSKLSYKEKTDLDARAYPNGIPPNTSRKSIVKARQALFSPSHGQIISQTTLVFWKRLYSGEYSNTLWKPSLKKVFPNKSLDRSDVSTALETIYAARNRVAHHEPVYGSRLEDTMRAIEFIRNSLGSKQENEQTNFIKFSNVHHLRLQMDYASFVEAWHTLT